MQVLNIPAAIPEKVERLLGPVIKSAPGDVAERSPGEWGCIEAQLVRWEQDAGELDDDELEPPNRESIPRIRDVAHALRDLAVEPPLRLVPNGESGAVFEWRTAPFLWSVEVEQDGSLELSVYRAGRLVTRFWIA